MRHNHQLLFIHLLNNLNMQKPFQFTVKNAIVPINDKIWNFPNAQGAVRTPSSQILAK
jgi:hypothetical protein